MKEYNLIRVEEGEKITWKATWTSRDGKLSITCCSADPAIAVFKLRLLKKVALGGF